MPQLFQDTLDDCLRLSNEEIQESAVSALKQFFLNCYSHPPKKAALLLVERYVKTLSDALNQSPPNPILRRGFSLALGVLPKDFIVASGQQSKLIQILISNSKLESKSENRDAESRRNSVRALADIVETLGLNLKSTQTSTTPTTTTEPNFDLPALSLNDFNSIWKALIDASNDYSIDNRGDVGSWVREMSLLSLEKIVRFILSDNNANVKLNEFLDQKQVTELFGSVIQQSVEKIDRMRRVSGQIFGSFLHGTNGDLKSLLKFVDDSNVHTFIPDIDLMLKLFSKEFLESNEFHWDSIPQTFPKFSQFLISDVFREWLLSGFIGSVGGMSKSLVIDHDNELLLFLLKSPKELVRCKRQNKILTIKQNKK